MFEDQNSVLGKAVFEEKLLPISGGGKKVARFVIGTSTAGWTLENCDYLCDGINDQVEINNAITALPTSGGEIVILDGTYNITASINISKNNVSIRGNGNATVLKRMWDSSSHEGVITLTSATGCRVENLQIDGNNETYTAVNNCGILLYSSSNNTITGNICNNNSVGICLYSSNINTVTGNTCNNNLHSGILLYSSSNNTVTGNTCTYNNYDGIFLWSYSNKNTVTDNTCTNNSTGIELSSSSETTVTGNTCNNNIDCGIYLYESSNNTVTGNTYTYNNKHGICLDSSSDNNTVTGNNCNNNSTGGILLAASSNNMVTGNTCIRGTGTPDDYTTDQGQYTILLSGTGNNYNLISSNNCMGKAVEDEGGTGNSVWGNKFNATSDLS